MKDAITFFFIQAFNYCLLTINFRVLAQGHIVATVASDAINCSFSFFVIRKIAKSDSTYQAFAGYLLGSVLGTYIGMKVT